MRIRAALPPLPVVQMPIIHAGEEKLIAFQKTVNGAIRETEVCENNNNDTHTTHITLHTCMHARSSTNPFSALAIT